VAETCGGAVCLPKPSDSTVSPGTRYNSSADVGDGDLSPLSMALGHRPKSFYQYGSKKSVKMSNGVEGNKS